MKELAGLNEGVRSTSGRGALGDIDSMMSQSKITYATATLPDKPTPKDIDKIKKIVVKNGFSDYIQTHPQNTNVYFNYYGKHVSKSKAKSLAKDISKALGKEVSVEFSHR